MQLLYAGVNSGDLGSMLGLGTKLLGSMDTNLNAMTAVTLASAVKGGDDRSEMALPTAEQVTERKPAAGRRNGHAEHGERGAV